VVNITEKACKNYYGDDHQCYMQTVDMEIDQTENTQNKRKEDKKHSYILTLNARKMTCWNAIVVINLARLENASTVKRLDAVHTDIVRICA